MGENKTNRKLRAVDLYSGVGGWSLGLRLAGIEVIASYERWGLANETNFKNNRHQAQTVDIRRLSLDDLPNDVDIVVGSPPCTQFSFSNRGGGGDLEDGLEDIIKFLTIVDHLKPKFWAMENVPRVAKILEHELRRGGRLARFKRLKIVPRVINMEDFGLPQRRRRCIAGNFDFDLLKAYSTDKPKRTLGNVVSALAAPLIIDPIYGLILDRTELRDHVAEDALNEEEIRINRASKVMHPVYNAMSFPDPLDKSVRTITATCTRVSRESIVIEDASQPRTFRRLTIRERASLQGFPITFQFYGDSYAQKLRMVGNAVPPSFSYYVAHALQGRAPEEVKKLSDFADSLKAPVPPAVDARPDKPGYRYPESRRFRFAIPSLRLKSGVRFELVNDPIDGHTEWRIAFYFGTSKSIQSLPLGDNLYTMILQKIPDDLCSRVRDELSQLADFIRRADIANMQRLWSHNGLGLTRPFMLLDQLDERGTRLIEILSGNETLTQLMVTQAIWANYDESAPKPPGISKLTRNAVLIVAGLLIGAVANIELSKHTEESMDGKGLKAAVG